MLFRIHAPPDTPDWEPLFLAGDGASLGDWSPHGVRLDRGGDGCHYATVDVPAGSRFLVTRGRWRVAEGDGHGHEQTARVVPEAGRAGPDELDVRVAGWGRDALHYYHNFRSDFLPHARTVTVYLPPGYDGRRRFPVLYLHDGQNLFDAATSFAGTPWGCDEVAEQAARAGRCARVILVGVANSPDRIPEYGPRRCGTGRAGDLSRQYGRFLVEEVKPFVDRTYATLAGPANTGVGGSSLGGLISLHLAKWYPAVFGRCAAVSPSLWWDQEYFLRNLHVNPAWLAGCRVWLDMGDREGMTRATQQAGVRRARRLAALLGKGEFTYREVPGGEHNEWHWGQRFGDVLGFLFPAAELCPSEPRA